MARINRKAMKNIFMTQITMTQIFMTPNSDGVIIHLEPDIPEYEIKWDLGSITTKKASGSDRIRVE